MSVKSSQLEQSWYIFVKSLYHSVLRLVVVKERELFLGPEVQQVAVHPQLVGELPVLPAGGSGKDRSGCSCPGCSSGPCKKSGTGR